MNRFFVKKENIDVKKIYIRDNEEVHHASKVLRLKEGEKVEVSDGEKFEYTCRITNVEKEEIELEILEKKECESESKNKYHLFQGMPKQGKLDDIVQKSIELGVYSVTPIYMKRSIVTKTSKDEKKTERLNTIALSAAKQSKRGIVPKVNKAIPFADVIKDLEAMDLIIFPYEEEKGKNIKELLTVVTEKDILMSGKESDIGIIIGPEGGFAEEEVKRLISIAATPVTLGNRILRTETASINVLSILMYELEM